MMQVVVVVLVVVVLVVGDPFQCPYKLLAKKGLGSTPPSLLSN